jgi:hypothetical protein
MAAATISPHKQCFLLDDDGEFPLMNKDLPLKDYKFCKKTIFFSKNCGAILLVEIHSHYPMESTVLVWIRWQPPSCGIFQNLNKEKIKLLCKVIQLNKCETDPYFLQNFHCTTMFISAFCKICELNTKREIVFVFCNVYLLALDNTKR